MHEIRLDVFKSVPKGLNDDSIITLCGNSMKKVPEWFNGMVDVGTDDVNTEKRTIRSIHDFNGTPRADEIVELMRGGNHISKGAFIVNSLTDLWNIHKASEKIKTRHVLIGMGITGEITRIRSELLGNEFTFGYHGQPTAAGQLSVDELESLDDDCEIVGIVGRSLSHSRSPMMQNAAMEHAGINGRYLTFESPDLEHLKDVMIDYEIRGLNVTIPFKERVIGQLDSISKTAKEIGAVNTVTNRDGELIGDNTDVIGIRTVISPIINDCDRILILGSGGVARAVAYTFTDIGREVSVTGRNNTTVDRMSRDFGMEKYDGRLNDYDLIVNCTPLGIVEGKYPINIEHLSSKQKVFDMVYGRITPLMEKAMRKGCVTIGGMDMLVAQGVASFRLWFDREPDTKVMRGVLA